MWHLLFLSQDTTDYVAYVAKDPVNRRGKPCVTSVISYSRAVGLNIGYKLVFMISALFTCTNKCSLVLSAIIELHRQWSVAARLGLGDAGYLRVRTTHLYSDGQHLVHLTRARQLPLRLWRWTQLHLKPIQTASLLPDTISSFVHCQPSYTALHSPGGQCPRSGLSS